MAPTQGTRVVAHVLVGAAVAFLAAKAVGKNAALVSGVAGMAAHAMLDAPVAKMMAANGLQF
jgi:hypothetical protein